MHYFLLYYAADGRQLLEKGPKGFKYHGKYCTSNCYVYACIIIPSSAVVHTPFEVVIPKGTEKPLLCLSPSHGWENCGYELEVHANELEATGDKYMSALW